jgi:hypothetical protein
LLVILKIHTMMKVLEVSLTLVMILTIANLNLLLNNVTGKICPPLVLVPYRRVDCTPNHGLNQKV